MRELPARADINKVAHGSAGVRLSANVNNE
jgi:hypothetical protein